MEERDILHVWILSNMLSEMNSKFKNFFSVLSMQVMLLVLLSCAEKKTGSTSHAYIEIMYLINIVFRSESVM